MLVITDAGCGEFVERTSQGRLPFLPRLLLSFPRHTYSQLSFSSTHRLVPVAWRRDRIKCRLSIIFLALPKFPAIGIVCCSNEKGCLITFFPTYLICSKCTQSIDCIELRSPYQLLSTIPAIWQGEAKSRSHLPWHSMRDAEEGQDHIHPLSFSMAAPANLKS